MPQTVLPTTAVAAQLEDWREQFPYRYTKVEGILKPQTAVEALRDAAAGLDHDVIWTTGVGQHQMWAMQYLVCDKPRSFITSGGLGTMGYGVPAAIGAKAARPDATVVCIDGDGCFQMTCQELATAALEGLPVVTAIINNGWLGMVRQWQEMFYAERFAQTHLTRGAGLRAARRGVRLRRVHRRERGSARGDAAGGVHRRPQRGHRRPLRPARRRSSRWCRPAPLRSTRSSRPKRGRSRHERSA